MLQTLLQTEKKRQNTHVCFLACAWIDTYDSVYDAHGQVRYTYVLVYTRIHAHTAYLPSGLLLPWDDSDSATFVREYARLVKQQSNVAL